jgi:hydrogenase maturation protease
MAAVLVLGLGNILMRDEGLGVRVVEWLNHHYEFPSDVEVVDGGTLGLDLLPMVEDAQSLLVVDALEVGKSPGTIVQLRDEEVPAFMALKVSPHQTGLPDLLAAAQLRGRVPSEVVLLGAQIGDLGLGLEMSEPVAEQVCVLGQMALDLLGDWDVIPHRRERTGEGSSKAEV